MRRSRQDRRSAGGAAPSLATLLAAPGAVTIFLPERATPDGSNRVASLSAVVGTCTVAEATDAAKPTLTATSPTGRKGLTLAASSSQKLVESSSALAAIIDGAQPYSSLWVAKFAGFSATRTVWGIGTAASSANCVQEGAASTSGNDDRTRGDAATTSNAGSAHSTSIECVSTVYNGSTYSSWINGTLSINAGANTRAPTCDTFSLGCRRLTGAYSAYMDGEIYCLIVSTSQWTTAERQALERAAKAYWGTT